MLVLSLTVLFSRLLQAFARAVREALHHAQEHAEAVRDPRELLRLWPPHRKHWGLLWRPGYLPQPLHGEYSPVYSHKSAFFFCSLHSSRLKRVGYFLYKSGFPKESSRAGADNLINVSYAFPQLDSTGQGCWIAVWLSLELLWQLLSLGMWKRNSFSKLIAFFSLYIYTVFIST